VTDALKEESLEPAPEVPSGRPGGIHRLLLRTHRLGVRLGDRWHDLEARLPRVIAVLRIAYLPFALLLVGYIGYDAATRVDLSTIRIWPLVLAYGAALVWWLALAFGWSTLITERIHLDPVKAWCKTQVTRYLPGGIWAPLTRATTVQGRVRDKAAAVAAENVIVLSAAVGVGALWATVHNPAWLPLAFVILLPVLCGRWLERRTRVTHTGVVRTTGIYAVGYVAYGLTGIFTQVAVSGIRHPTYPLYVAGAACLAWAAGLVVVFAPGGVGVREVVYVWALRDLYPRADLQAAAISARLVTVLAELTVLALVSLPLWRSQASAVP
jgi:glycosyltransferase 2 family protein